MDDDSVSASAPFTPKDLKKLLRGRADLEDSGKRIYQLLRDPNRRLLEAYILIISELLAILPGPPEFMTICFQYIANIASSCSIREHHFEAQNSALRRLLQLSEGCELETCVDIVELIAVLLSPPFLCTDDLKLCVPLFQRCLAIKPDYADSYAEVLRALSIFIEHVGDPATALIIDFLSTINFSLPLPQQAGPPYAWLAWMRLTFLLAQDTRYPREQVPWPIWLQLTCATSCDPRIPVQAALVFAHSLWALAPGELPTGITVEDLLDVFNRLLPDPPFDLAEVLASILCWIPIGFGSGLFYERLTQNEYAKDLLLQGVSETQQWSHHAIVALFCLARDAPPDIRPQVMGWIIDSCQEAEPDDEEVCCLQNELAQALSELDRLPA
jgi:hypothetical protein